MHQLDTPSLVSDASLKNLATTQTRLSTVNRLSQNTYLKQE